MDRTLSNGGPSPKNGCTIRYLVGPSKISQLWMELGHLCFGAPFPSIRCIRSNIIPAFSTASSVLEMRRFWSVLTSRVFQEERNGFSKKASIIYSIRVWHGFCCKGSYKFIYIYIHISICFVVISITYYQLPYDLRGWTGLNSHESAEVDVAHFVDKACQLEMLGSSTYWLWYCALCCEVVRNCMYIYIYVHYHTFT